MKLPPASDERKRKISAANTGRNKGIHLSPTTEFKKGSIPWNKGKHNVYSAQTRFRMAWSRGLTLSPEQRARMKGHTPWNKGLKGYLSGPDHHNWKGGISKLPSYRSFLQTRRMIRKRLNGGSHTLEQWLRLKQMHAFLCNECGDREPNVKLTEDHIIPLSKGGSDDITNIQPLCAMCNSRKRNTLTTENNGRTTLSTLRSSPAGVLA